MTRNNKSVAEWVRNNADHYDKTAARLAATKERFLSAERDVQFDMLHKSRAFAVLSIQTKVHKHELAYAKWLINGEVSKDTMYHNTKADYLQDIDMSAYHRAIDMLEDGEVEEAWLVIANDFKGTAYVKAAFVLAMLGFENMLCVDSNVAKRCGFDRCRTKSEYLQFRAEIRRRYSHLDMSTFMTQWAIFDCERGVPSTHRIWFDSVGTWK